MADKVPCSLTMRHPTPCVDQKSGGEGNQARQTDTSGSTNFLIKTPTTQRQLSNLRARAALPRPWEVQAGELLATVQETRLPNLIDKTRWKLDVKLQVPSAQPWRLKSITVNNSSKGHATLQNFAPDSDPRTGHRGVQLVITANFECSPDFQQREPIILDVTYEFAGKIKTVPVEIDHACLVGDTITYDGLAKYIRSHLNDPLIRKLMARAAGLPRGSVFEEVERLKKWLGMKFKKNGILEKSFLLPTPLRITNRGDAYYLSPTEVARHGGVCVHYSILIGAYLAARGFKTYSALIVGHAWIKVQEGNKWVDIDWVNPGPHGEWSPELAPIANDPKVALSK